MTHYEEPNQEPELKELKTIDGELENVNHRINQMKKIEKVKDFEKQYSLS